MYTSSKRLIVNKNHSCDPTCSVSFVYHNDADFTKPLFALFTKRDVDKDEELTFAYFGEADEDDFEEVMQREEPLVCALMQN